jgi:hypothetical protein
METVILGNFNASSRPVLNFRKSHVLVSGINLNNMGLSPAVKLDIFRLMAKSLLLVENHHKDILRAPLQLSVCIKSAHR